MILDIIQVVLSGFVCYCLYLVVIVPRIEKRRNDLRQAIEYFKSIEKNDKNI